MRQRKVFKTLNKSFLFGQKWGKLVVQYGTLKGFFFAKKNFKKWSLNKKAFPSITE